MIAEAFDSIKDGADPTFDKCEKAYNLLSDLNFLPNFRMNETPNTANLTKIAENFCLRDRSLQEMTFDCVMAISKLCKILNQAITFDDRMMNDNTHRGKQVRDEVKARREH